VKIIRQPEPTSRLSRTQRPRKSVRQFHMILIVSANPTCPVHCISKLHKLPPSATTVYPAVYQLSCCQSYHPPEKFILQPPLARSFAVGTPSSPLPELPGLLRTAYKSRHPINSPKLTSNARTVDLTNAAAQSSSPSYPSPNRIYCMHKALSYGSLVRPLSPYSLLCHAPSQKRDKNLQL
jgi:hypothetical protein